MRIAYFDTIAGISGDMTLGAFVSAGVRIDELTEELRKLNVSGVEIQASHKTRSGIDCVKVDVLTGDDRKPHRHLRDIIELLDTSTLAPTVKERAGKIFREVAEAEARVHRSTPEKVHFHEVGALDSLVDIVGTAICLNLLGVGTVYSSPVKLGSGGTVDTQHGVIPVPTPATVEILRGYPTILTDIPHELTTPTGAAIIKALSAGILSAEQIVVESVGYGAGTKEFPELPNLLRVMIGELKPEYEQDALLAVETNIDDMNPEIMPYVVERLFAAGAHDAYVVPVIMKKGRHGSLLSTLVERSKLDPILAVLFRETTTLGVRIQPVERRKLPRARRQVHTSIGIVTVKTVVRDGKEVLVPEYEECRRVALGKNLPLVDVYRTIERELNRG